MKLLTAAYKVLNEADYIGYSLRQIYDWVDEIIICEGMVEHNEHSADSTGLSVDDTLKIITDFPDKDNKIQLYSRRWKSKEEAQDFLREKTTSKWIFFIDADETYSTSDLMYLRMFADVNQDRYILAHTPVYHFWHNFNQHITGPGSWNMWQMCHPCLVNMNVEGLSFAKFHTTPTDKDGRILEVDPLYRDKRINIHQTWLYHYGDIRTPTLYHNKLLYQMKRGTGEVKNEGDIDNHYWFTGKLPDGFRILKFHGEHPETFQTHPYKKNPP